MEISPERNPKAAAEAQKKRPSVVTSTLQHSEPTGAPAGFKSYPSGGGVAQNLDDLGVCSQQEVIYNAAPPKLYEFALKYEKGTIITNTGAMAAFSGLKTGRSPKDKRVVEEADSKDDVWWGPVNFPQTEEAFMLNRERAIDFLNVQDRIFVVDAFAGWDVRYRIKVRILCSRAYHALFMNNMLIRPTDQELEEFGEPDFTIFNAGTFPCNRYVPGMSSSTSVSIHFGRHEMVILGTQYAGEMKKGILTVMMYLMPKRGLLTLHSSCNEDTETGNTTLFFGLSGTGKTTLSADPKRNLLGDDEHVWHDDGVFNIEGGCYAKCIGLTKEQEPEIYDAIRFGSVVENVVIDDHTRTIDYNDCHITENTRCAYPLEFIPNAKIPAVGNHPTNVILLTCDAFGVLPPVSKLTPEQCMYQFISGYTAKVAGTEEGVVEPTPNFSACFGGPFLVWHPVKYADMLAEKLKQTGAQAWLINTGWVGGKYGVGSRIKLRYTRAMVTAINNHTLEKVEFEEMPGTGLLIPKEIPNSDVPSDLLFPWKTWSSLDEYKETLNNLTTMFQQNFDKFADKASHDLLKSAPKKWE
eukprot:TRINITY_DN33351_c0_g1_i1.p1 TRINITY_DN33351_c0_g1~~TRINITY_DN33351_c0_g1_i1.p1  ORF type:complete len:580 (+),score=244.60 TRINITY_DN33351_c0_g1_i1:46-1785(+)